MERYLRAHSVIQYHNELASNVTNELATRSYITERVKRLVGNEIELGIVIPMIESQASNIPIDKGNCIRDYLNPSPQMFCIFFDGFLTSPFVTNALHTVSSKGL